MPAHRFRSWPSLVLVGVILACWWQMPADTGKLFLHSLTLAGCTIALALPVSLLVAYARSQANRTAGELADISHIILLFMPLYLQLAGWEAGFGRGGWYSTLIAADLSEPPLEGLRGAAFVHAVAALPFLYWLLRLGFASVPQRLLDSAALDGSAWQVFRRVTLPLSMPVVMGSCLYITIVTMTEITVTDRYQFRSYAEVLYNEFALNPSFADLPLQLAPVLLNQLSLVLMGLLFCRLSATGLLTADRGDFRKSNTATKKWASWFLIIAATSLLGVPLLNLLYQAGIEVQQVGESRVRTWSAIKCLRLTFTSPWTYREEIAWSAILAQLSAFSSLAIAVAWAWWSRLHPLRRWAGLVLGVLCFATPGTLIAFGIIYFLNRPHDVCIWLYDDTLAAPWLAMTLKCLPFSLLVIWYGLRSIPRAVFENARRRWSKFAGHPMPCGTAITSFFLLSGIPYLPGRLRWRA